MLGNALPVATARSRPELPVERITPGSVFDKVGVNYAGPVLIKYGYVRKPTIVKAYICVFVSLSVKAVHLELVTDLNSEAFIVSLKRFISRRGLPSVIWSDNGTDFVGAARRFSKWQHPARNMLYDWSAYSLYCYVYNHSTIHIQLTAQNKVTMQVRPDHFSTSTRVGMRVYLIHVSS